jgi:hypothetical protein
MTVHTPVIVLYQPSLSWPSFPSVSRSYDDSERPVSPFASALELADLKKVL